MFFDELPTASLVNERGRVDRRLYPNFARLSKDSTWFRNASGVSGFTPFAVPAMLTGRYPREKLAPSYLTYPDTLFTLLAGTYDVRASESVAQLCPPRICRTAGVSDRDTGLRPVLKDMAIAGGRILSPFGTEVDPTQQFVDQALDEREQEPGGRDAPTKPRFRFKELKATQPTRVTEFVESLEPSARPTFHFLHVLLPHAPWRYLPSGRTYPGRKKLVAGAPGGLEPTAERWPALVNVQRHLLQLAYTDRVVGEIVRRLKAQRMWDQSLVVMTADHGARFTREPRGGPTEKVRQLDAGNAFSLGYVPMFIKRPGQRRGRTDDRNFVTVDLVPTIADVLGVRPTWRVEGFSAFGPDRRRSPVKPWYNQPGQRITFSVPASYPRALRGLAPGLARPEHGPPGLFEFGPRRDLVGARVGDLAAGARVRGASVRGNVGESVRVDPGSGTVPAEVWGTPERLRPGAAVAVAVNGVVGGVSLVATKPKGGELEIATMVSDRLFRPGENSVRLYLVEGPAGRERLRPVRLTRSS